MRGKPGKALRGEFETRLSAAFPEFVRDESVQMPPGWDVYKWEIAGEFQAFFVLALSPKDDSFTVEVAWTRGAEYPQRYDMRRGEEAGRDEERFRLPELCEPYRDRWWYLAEQTSIWDDAIFDLPGTEEPVEMALARIPAALDEVFEQIKQYAVPYLISQKDHGELK